MSRSAIDLAEQYGAHNYHPLDVVLVRGEGVWVWDDAGNQYLDCLAAYSALNQGHCHPRIHAALVAQAERLTLTSRAFHNAPMGPFLEKLCRVTGFDKALPMNTGAEAVETAIKAVRKHGYTVQGIPEGEAEIVVCADNFHGRTTTIVGFSSDPQTRAGFGPFTPGFVVVPFGDAEALAAAVHDKTVAVLLEPIQGEAGIHLPPEGYLAEVRRICDDRGVLMILDEIQTGLGRTGALFAFEHAGIRPDGVTVGKALSGGFYPVSAFLGSEEILGVFTPGDHGSTFGGNPLGSAVADAALDVLLDEDLPGRAATLGPWFLEQLRALESPHVAEIRGRGLMIAVEIDRASGPARPFCEALRDRGILCKETHGQVIRITPPLVVTREDLAWALPRFADVLA